MNTTHLDQKRKALLDRREKLITRFGEGIRARKSTARVCTELRRANEFIESLERIEAEQKENDSGRMRRYAVSSFFLHESYRRLTADADEQFFFITGAEVGGVMVLDQAAEFAHQKRTRLGVTADPPSTHNLLIRLERFKHRLLAHFHSHPGKGAEATNPSGIDERFQKRLEDAGHVAVMAIFSRDGYVRFIRLDQNLDLEIYGEGVENHAPGIYRLTHID